MRRPVLTIFNVLVAVGFSAPAVSAQVQGPGEDPGEPRISLWGTGDGMGAFHNVSADCVTLVHGFGRNAVWGRWTMRPEAVAIEVVPQEEGADLVFSCNDGSACIAERVDGDRMIARHRISFTARDRADWFARQLKNQASRCARGTS